MDGYWAIQCQTYCIFSVIVIFSRVQFPQNNPEKGKSNKCLPWKYFSSLNKTNQKCVRLKKHVQKYGIPLSLIIFLGILHSSLKINHSTSSFQKLFLNNLHVPINHFYWLQVGLGAFKLRFSTQLLQRMAETEEKTHLHPAAASLVGDWKTTIIGALKRLQFLLKRNAYAQQRSSIYCTH